MNNYHLLVNSIHLATNALNTDVINITNFCSEKVHWLVKRALGQGQIAGSRAGFVPHGLCDWAGHLNSELQCIINEGSMNSLMYSTILLRSPEEPLNKKAVYIM